MQKDNVKVEGVNITVYNSLEEAKKDKFRHCYISNRWTDDHYTKEMATIVLTSDVKNALGIDKDKYAKLNIASDRLKESKYTEGQSYFFSSKEHELRIRLSQKLDNGEYVNEDMLVKSEDFYKACAPKENFKAKENTVEQVAKNEEVEEDQSWIDEEMDIVF